MHTSLAAIRAGRSATRYVVPAVGRRQRRLGLPYSAYQHQRARPGGLQRRPVDALRAAARSHVVTPSASSSIGRRDLALRLHLSWSRHVATGLRRVRPRSAAPWRG
jgi:hypothetical protein